MYFVVLYIVSGQKKTIHKQVRIRSTIIVHIDISTGKQYACVTYRLYNMALWRLAEWVMQMRYEQIKHIKTPTKIIFLKYFCRFSGFPQPFSKNFVISMRLYIISSRLGGIVFLVSHREKLNSPTIGSLLISRSQTISFLCNIT